MSLSIALIRSIKSKQNIMENKWANIVASQKTRLGDLLLVSCEFTIRHETPPWSLCKQWLWWPDTAANEWMLIWYNRHWMKASVQRRDYLTQFKAWTMFNRQTNSLMDDHSDCTCVVNLRLSSFYAIFHWIFCISFSSVLFLLKSVWFCLVGLWFHWRQFSP